jgi:hypothetical protein
MSPTTGEADKTTPSTVPASSAISQTKGRCSFTLFSRRNDWTRSGEVDCVSFEPDSMKPFDVELTDAQKQTLGSPRGHKKNIHVPKAFNLVSRNHASFVATDKQLFLFESKAKYGTKLDGQKLQLNTFYPLKEGSQVTLSPDCRAHGTAFDFEVESISFGKAPATPSVTFSSSSIVYKYDSEVSQGTSMDSSPNDAIVIDIDSDDEDTGEQSDIEVVGCAVSSGDNGEGQVGDAQRCHWSEEDEEDRNEDEDEEDEEDDEDEEDEEDEEDDEDDEEEEEDEDDSQNRNQRWLAASHDSDDDKDHDVEPATLVELLRSAPTARAPDENPRQIFFKPRRSNQDTLFGYDTLPAHEPGSFQTPENQFDNSEEAFLFEEDERAESLLKVHEAPAESSIVKPADTSEVSVGQESTKIPVTKSNEVAMDMESTKASVKPVSTTVSVEATTQTPLIEKSSIIDMSTVQEPAESPAFQDASTNLPTVKETIIHEPAATAPEPLPTAAFQELASIPRVRKRTREEMVKEEEDLDVPLPKKSTEGRRIGQIFTAVAAGMLVGSIGTVTALASMST